ncbi:hypothetical protein A2U01_0098065, partial [Trifolium medium]|nr:hypothetical protein [Trifolium medium]
MPRGSIEVKCFDELGGKRDCVNETMEAKEGIFIIVANGFIVEMER